MEATTKPRFDYVKLFFSQDHDYFQAHTLPLINTAISYCDPVGQLRTCSRLSALGGSNPKESRYIFEVWGPMADKFALHMVPRFWANLRRLDLRVELDELSQQQMLDASRYLAHRETKHNTALFNSQPRHKRGEARDIGGIGIWFGSRKSAQHGVIYKRGKEQPAAEYRIKDREAQRLGHAVIQQTEEKGWLSGYTFAMRDMLEMNAAFWGSRVGSDLSQTLKNAAKQGAQLSEVARQLGLFDETPEEASAWQELSTEEQLDLQNVTWELTPKGSHNPWAEYERDPTIENGLDYRSDEELPF